MFGNFIFENECRDWCGAYVAALKILGETPKDQWTPEDVVDAVSRATSLPNVESIHPESKP